MTRQRDDLEVLRLGLLEAFEVADASVKAQIAGQLRAVVKDLAALAEPEGTSTADELLAKRAARIAGAGHSAPASRRGQSRRSGRSDRAG